MPTGRLQVGLKKLKDGIREVGDALDLTFGLALPGEPERRARDGLKTLRSALDWLEDSEHFDRAHEALDWAGRSIRTTFGCRLEFDPDRGYSQTCPVALAHTRVGLSTAYIIRESECSICGRDPEDCDHISGREYEGKACFRRVTRADIDHIALVDRPKQIDTRITSQSVSLKKIRDALGPEFFYGTPVSCDRCLTPCNGMSEMNLGEPVSESNSNRAEAAA